MKVAIFLMSEGERPAWDQQSPAEQAAALQQHDDFGAACAAREGVRILTGEALDGVPTVVRTRDGERIVTEGPYAEAVEQLGGLYVVETPDLATLLELTALLPPYDLQLSPIGAGEES